MKSLRDQLLHFTKREMPKFKPKPEVKARDHAPMWNDVLEAHRNERIESRKRQRNAGQRGAMNALRSGNALTIEQQRVLGLAERRVKQEQYEQSQIALKHWGLLQE